MKSSLEDERRALLEQIEASRSVYRRMLADEPDPAAARRPPYANATARHAQDQGAGTRAMQWMMDHPLWVAGGVALVVLLAPRVISARKRATRHAERRQREPEPRQGGTARALLTAAALLLRDPARMRAAARMAQAAWQWMQRRRAAAPPPLPPTVTRTTRLH